MTFFVLLALFGVILLVYGIRSLRRISGEPHIADAEVVGYHPTALFKPKVVDQLNEVVDAAHVVVNVTLHTGEVRTMYTTDAIRKFFLEQSPEMAVGEKIQVVYYGDDPKGLFLKSLWDLEKPEKEDAAVIAGVLFIIVSVSAMALFLYAKS